MTHAPRRPRRLPAAPLCALDDLGCLPRVGAVYCLFSAVDKSLYVGESTDLQARIRQHRDGLRRGNHSNRSLQRVFDRYPDSFVVYLLEKQPNESRRRDAELEWYLNLPRRYYRLNRMRPLGAREQALAREVAAHFYAPRFHSESNRPNTPE